MAWSRKSIHFPRLCLGLYRGRAGRTNPDFPLRSLGRVLELGPPLRRISEPGSAVFGTVRPCNLLTAKGSSNLLDDLPAEIMRCRDTRPPEPAAGMGNWSKLRLNGPMTGPSGGCPVIARIFTAMFTRLSRSARPDPPLEGPGCLRSFSGESCSFLVPAGGPRSCPGAS